MLIIKSRLSSFMLFILIFSHNVGIEKKLENGEKIEKKFIENDNKFQFENSTLRDISLQVKALNEKLQKNENDILLTTFMTTELLAKYQNFYSNDTVKNKLEEYEQEVNLKSSDDFFLSALGKRRERE